jgi:hypothetical protein
MSNKMVMLLKNKNKNKACREREKKKACRVFLVRLEKIKQPFREPF